MHKDQDYSTRTTVLHLLKTKGHLTVNDMACELGVTDMAVRRHIHILERDGLVEARLARKAMGRPTKVYSLLQPADDLFPKNYHQLALELLGELAEEDRGMVEELFESRKMKMLAKYEHRMAGKSLSERVAELADIQEAGGYMVSLEDRGEGVYVLEEYNCPINQVARVHGQACSCELSLFRKLLEAEVERTECLAKDGGKCAYRIEPKQGLG